MPEVCTKIWKNSNKDLNTKRQFDGEFFNGSIGSRTANEAH